METINPFLATDGYKTGHKFMYPEKTTLVQTNFTPRSGRYATPNIGGVINFGTQMVIDKINTMFQEGFFQREKMTVLTEIKEAYEQYLGMPYDIDHITRLYDLGYLPIEMKAIPEGTFVKYGVPVLTVHNTHKDFYWLPTFLETIISNLMWLPITSATTAYNYKKLLTKYATETDEKNVPFVDFQGHDFSMRGMSSLESTISSSLGHALFFKGSDSLPVIYGTRRYYLVDGVVVNSVPATEHAVMCAGTKDDEIGTFRRLMKTFPKGILSVVSDTWDLWHVCTNILPELKEEILARDGKLVIRPDSGDPVDILCGVKDDMLRVNTSDEYASDEMMYLEDYDGEIICIDNQYYKVNGVTDFIREYGQDAWAQVNYLNMEDMVTGGRCGVLYPVENPNSYTEPETKGVIELLWDVFGGTTNEQGYKVLDPHIGAIYGDSITYDRATQICERLKTKGFASTNVVLGIGSYTYQYVTRDTHGLACKSTYVEVDGVPREIFKDPITDDGTKKSAKGAVMVIDGELVDQVKFTATLSDRNDLKTIYLNGSFKNKQTFTQIQERLSNESNL